MRVYSTAVRAFVIVQHQSRRIVHFGVTEHPTDEWVRQQLRPASAFDEKPKHSIRDNDKKYGEGFERVAKASGIQVIHTPHEAPHANAIYERFAAGLRRECLDHVLVIGVLQWIRILKECVSYFNQAPPHQAIVQRILEATQSPHGKTGAALAFPVLNGLHHEYRRVA